MCKSQTIKELATEKKRKLVTAHTSCKTDLLGQEKEQVIRNKNGRAM
jgi:hypothetical protein